MQIPRPASLRGADWRAALAFINDLAAAHAERDGFVRCALAGLPRMVPSELTTLSFCELASGHRMVQGDSACAIGPVERECFDRHFHRHPLVRVHGALGWPHAHRISDSIAFAQFRHSELYADYYRRIGIDHVLAVPVCQDRGWLVSWVLNRRGRDFTDRELALLDQVRQPMAVQFRQARLLERMASHRHPVAAAMPALRADLPLTTREHELLAWVAAGKTDKDVAAIVGISVRTVHKHLQHIYTKLGVETRTAAVVRALA